MTTSVLYNFTHLGRRTFGGSRAWNYYYYYYLLVLSYHYYYYYYYYYCYCYYYYYYYYYLPRAAARGARAGRRRAPGRGDN